MDLTLLRIRVRIESPTLPASELDLLWAQEGILALSPIFSATEHLKANLRVVTEGDPEIATFCDLAIPIVVVRSDASALVARLSRSELTAREEERWNALVTILTERVSRHARLEPRLSVEEMGFGAWITSPSNGKALISDISAGGMRLLTNFALPVGEKVEFTIEVPQSLPWAKFVQGLTGVGLVRNSSPDQLGIYFPRNAPFAQKMRRLVHVITEQLVEWNKELRRLNSKLEQLTLIDGLTGLYNHRGFQQRLAEEFARVTRNKENLSLLFLDVDYFKNFNDTNGHPEGDELLKGLATLLMSGHGGADAADALRHSDTAARYGGEEFAIILPSTDLQGVCTKADRIRASVESYPFSNRERQPGNHVTMSIGVAEFPGDARSPADLIARADEALLSAKKEGRNRVRKWRRETVSSGSVVQFPSRK